MYRKGFEVDVDSFGRAFFKVLGFCNGYIFAFSSPGFLNQTRIEE